MRTFFKILLELTRWQRLIITILMTIAMITTTIALSWHSQNSIPNYAVAMDMLDTPSDVVPITYSTHNKHDITHAIKQKFDTASPKVEYFMFDPNSINIEQWQQLGVEKYVAQRLVNYTKKGGHFYTKQDLKKFNSLRPELYEKLQSYISIQPSSAQPPMTNLHQLRYAQKIIIVDINTNNEYEWAALNGIGEKLAQRIIKYKNRLGGFYSIDQIAEVWGIADTLFKKIKPNLMLNNPQLVKININTATESMLQGHPYIGFKWAKIIVNYRQQHQWFKSIDELKAIKNLDIATFEKIKYYLVLN